MNRGNLGRGRGVSLDQEEHKCVCTRPDTNVLCNVCGYITKGRIRKTCPKHKLTLYLMDIQQCPRCKAYSFMMQEFTTTSIK
ncbi:hypothetical protein L798_01143 [Zootermopsis nevadensis]|uniref:Uncharacterized protein n=2 Tax=Zootermopsis nevadensis TaxID=136037 RepID=A0A067QJ94_ZOONE|nr:hypothetical protein L798_01143 [Zootermopsis nevadensis]